MFKFTCLVLYAVAVSLSSVYAGEDAKAAYREAIKPSVMECAEKHGVTEADLAKAKESRSPDSLPPCFVGCVFEKFEIINDKGEYDMDANLAKMKELIKNEDHYTVLSEIAKKCESVNSASVSDGAKGCDRAVLLMKCFMDHKSEIPM